MIAFAGMAGWATTNGPGSSATLTTWSYDTHATGNVYTYQRPDPLPDPIEVSKARASRAAHAVMVEASRNRAPEVRAARARNGFAQFARLPCYRGGRLR